jgi:hypothetical protein
MYWCQVCCDVKIELVGNANMGGKFCATAAIMQVTAVPTKLFSKTQLLINTL